MWNSNPIRQNRQVRIIAAEHQAFEQIQPGVINHYGPYPRRIIDLAVEIRRLREEIERLRHDAEIMAPYVRDGGKEVWDAVDRWLQKPARGHQP